MKNIFTFFSLAFGVVSFCNGNCMDSRQEANYTGNDNQHTASIGTTYRRVGSESLIRFMKHFVASGGGRYDYMLISDSHYVGLPNLHVNDVLQFVVNSNGTQRQSGKDVLVVNELPNSMTKLPFVHCHRLQR